MSSATRKGRSSTKNGSTKFKPTFNYLVAIGDEECVRTMLGAMYRNLLEAREIISELPYGVDEERNYYGVGKKVSEPIEVEPYCDSWSLSELELKIHTPFCREPVLAFNPKIDSEVILHRRKEYVDEYEPELFVSMPRKKPLYSEREVCDAARRRGARNRAIRVVPARWLVYNSGVPHA